MELRKVFNYIEDISEYLELYAISIKQVYLLYFHCEERVELYGVFDSKECAEETLEELYHKGQFEELGSFEEFKEVYYIKEVDLNTRYYEGIGI